MTAAFAGAPNPGDTSNEAMNAFNKRTDVPASEVTGIEVANDSTVVGPTRNPQTGQWPKEYWRVSPVGDPDNVPTQLKETGWEPSDIVPIETQES